MEFKGFDPSMVKFLAQLARNNDRQWFERNRQRYEELVREPALAFIRAIAPRIERISPHIFVSDSKVGGSMMRPFRDTRFSSSKLPYKTNLGIHFRHELGEDAHAPGLWMHVEPGEFWLAVGMWKPDAATTDQVRRHIAAHGDLWLAARNGRRFRAAWEIVGDSLKRPPRGYDPNHPLIDDLKRTEFLGLRDLGMTELYRKDVVALVANSFAAASDFMKFLCDAIEVDF